jgi:hypothetical protein
MNRYAWPLLAALLAPCIASAIDNEYVRITRDGAPCAAGSPLPGCGYRVIVALRDITLQFGQSYRKLSRGDLQVFGPGETYAAPAGGGYLEVAVKPDHPASDAPGEIIAPEKNAMLYEGEGFFIFEERLSPGDTRARHSHSQRVVIQLNRTRLRQWPDGKPQLELETVPDRPTFSPPVIHVVENVGDVPLRGVIIEFRPGRHGPERR